jgi:DNA-binding transcriptional regulator YiaG
MQNRNSFNPDFIHRVLEWCKVHGVNDIDSIMDLLHLIDKYNASNYSPAPKAEYESRDCTDLRNRRFTLRLTQKKVAFDLGINASHLSLVEVGLRTLSPKLKKLLSEYYDNYS